MQSKHNPALFFYRNPDNPKIMESSILTHVDDGLSAFRESETAKGLRNQIKDLLQIGEWSEGEFT